MSTVRPTIEALRNGPSSVVVELSIGGQILRYTDGGAVVVSSRAPGASDRRFLPGLAIGPLSEQVAIFSGDISPRSVSLDLVVTVEIAALLRSGHSIYSATAEISRIWPEQEWEDRKVLLRGYVDEPMWGGAGEIFSFAVSEDPGSDPALIIPSTWASTSATFPRASGERSPEPAYVGASIGRDPNIDGTIYPIVIGYPGSGVPVETPAPEWGSQIPGSPALYVELTSDAPTNTDHIIMISGGPVEATACKVWNVTDRSKTVASTTVKTSKDKLGQAFSYILTTSSDRPDEGDELWASWLPASGGGMSDPYGPGTLRRADHVIRWALAQSGLRVDDAMIPRLSILSSIKIDGYINAAVSPWEWLSSSILPLLPCSPVWGPDGLYVAVWQLGAQVSDAVARIDVGRNAARITPVSMSGSDEVVNRLTLSFAPNGSNGNFSQYRTLTGIRSAVEAADPAVLPNPWCARSQSVGAWGVRESTIETSYIYDQASAEIILGWQARMLSFPRRRVGVLLSERLAYLRPGDAVAFSDADLSVSEQVAHIDSITPVAGGIEVGMWWLEPARLQ